MRLEGALADGAAEARFVRAWHAGAARRARGAAFSSMPVRRTGDDPGMTRKSGKDPGKSGNNSE